MNLIFKNAKLLLILLLAIFTFFVTNIHNFTLDASSDSLVLEDDKDLLYFQKLTKLYKSDDFLIISYQVTDELLSKDQLAHLSQFVAELKNIKQVSTISSILSVPLFSSPPLSIADLGGPSITIQNNNADLKLAKQEFKTSPLYANNLVSLDGKTTAIFLKLKQNLIFSKLREQRNQMRTQNLTIEQHKQLQIISKQVAENATVTANLNKKVIQKIRSIIVKNSNKAQIFLGGLPMITSDIIDYIGNDLVVFSIIVILVMTLILTIIFKNLRFVMMPISISVVSSLTMTGILGFLNWKVTVISANFFSLLLVMTLSVVIHLIVRYRELAQKTTTDKNQLIKQTLHQMFKPCLYTTITTIIAFVSLLISGIRPVIDFGYMMAIGVSLAFIISFISFPIIMHLLPQVIIKQHKTEFFATKVFANITQKFGQFIIYCALFILLISAYGISKISVENRFIDYFKSGTEINQGLSLIDDKLGGTIPLEVIIDELGEDYWYDSDIRDEMSEVHHYLDSLNATGKVLSIETLMQLLATANGGNKPSGFFLNVIKNNIPDYAKDSVLRPYINENVGQLRFVARIKESSKNLNRKQLITDIKAHLINNLKLPEKNVHISGMMVLYNNMLQSLFDSQIKTIGLVFLMIFIMFLLLFRSFSLALIAITPNILPSLLILGLMGLLGIPLDLMTITIAAIAIGIGVDNAIHYIQRFKDEFKLDNDYLASMFRAHSSIGLAMFYTSITVTLGFVILVFSNFIPSIYFGLFTAIAMFSAVVLNLTLLPRLLILLKPKIK